MKKLFIGIDFSKEKVDVAIISAEALVEASARVFNEFKNSVSGYKQLVKWVDKNANGIDSSMWLFCGENTGDYSKPLCNGPEVPRPPQPLWVWTPSTLMPPGIGIRPCGVIWIVLS